MTEQDAIIKAIHHCIADESFIQRSEGPFCAGCPYEDDPICVATLKSDIQKLLKAQEPRVMTLEEVQQHNNQDGCVWFEQPTYNAVAAFVRKDEFEIEVISPYILGEPINHGYWLSSNYNVTWRCWTSRPTDEQREETPWTT